MKVGDRVYLLMDLEVEEWEVYEIRERHHYGGPWIKRDGRLGCALSYYTGRHYPTIDAAVEAARKARERAIKRFSRTLERLALNHAVKVRLLKSKHPKDFSRPNE